MKIHMIRVIAPNNRRDGMEEKALISADFSLHTFRTVTNEMSTKETYLECDYFSLGKWSTSRAATKRNILCTRRCINTLYFCCVSDCRHFIADVL